MASCTSAALMAAYITAICGTVGKSACILRGRSRTVLLRYAAAKILPAMASVGQVAYSSLGWRRQAPAAGADQVFLPARLQRHANMRRWPDVATATFAVCILDDQTSRAVKSARRINEIMASAFFISGTSDAPHPNFSEDFSAIAALAWRRRQLLPYVTDISH